MPDPRDWRREADLWMGFAIAGWVIVGVLTGVMLVVALNATTLLRLLGEMHTEYRRMVIKRIHEDA